MRPRGFIAGLLLGTVGVVASGLLSRLGSPPAYGVCVACHGRDLLAAAGLQALLGRPAVAGTVLTTVGLAGGAFLAARLFGEHRWRPARRPALSLLLGALTMIASLLALGCTTRLVLRVGYGDPLALWSLGGVAAGIVAVTQGMVLLARRSEARGGDLDC